MKDVTAKIVNYSGGSVSLIPNTIYDESSNRWISLDGMISRTIPSYGKLKANVDIVNVGKIQGFPIFKKVVTYLENIPEDIDYDYIVVTREYAEATNMLGLDTSRLLLISDPITLNDGKTRIGCRGLIPYDHDNTLFSAYVEEEGRVHETV